MIRYQGENIDFAITLNDSSSISSWKVLDEVYVYLYTDPSNIIKFTIENKTGYRLLTISSDEKTLTGSLLPTDTLTMRGAVRMDILGTNGSEKVYINSLSVGIDIANAPIKNEVQ